MLPKKHNYCISNDYLDTPFRGLCPRTARQYYKYIINEHTAANFMSRKLPHPKFLLPDITFTLSSTHWSRPNTFPNTRNGLPGHHRGSQTIQHFGLELSFLLCIQIWHDQSPAVLQFLTLLMLRFNKCWGKGKIHLPPKAKKLVLNFPQWLRILAPSGALTK